MIRADLGEVKREDIEITLQDDVLTLKRERRLEETREDEKQYRVESFYGKP